MSAATEAVDPDFKRDILGRLPALRAFAVSLCGRSDFADDLVQTTILRAWANQQSFQPGTNMKAWLFRILRNEFYSVLRRSGREVSDSDGLQTDRMAVQAPQQASLELKDIRVALDALPEDQREAVVLVGASGFSYEEAAEICGCAVGTLKSRVNRARVRLRDLLELADGEAAAPEPVGDYSGPRS